MSITDHILRQINFDDKAASHSMEKRIRSSIACAIERTINPGQRALVKRGVKCFSRAKTPAEVEQELHHEFNGDATMATESLTLANELLENVDEEISVEFPSL